MLISLDSREILDEYIVRLFNQSNQDPELFLRPNLMNLPFSNIRWNDQNEVSFNSSPINNRQSTLLEWDFNQDNNCNKDSKSLVKISSISQNAEDQIQLQRIEKLQGIDDIAQVQAIDDDHKLQEEQNWSIVPQFREIFNTEKQSEKKEKLNVKKNKFSRHQKNDQQIRILENQFFKTQLWSRNLIEELSLKLQLRPQQIYKWYYDKINYKSKKRQTQRQSEVQ
ncbi:UNKNOWN [Stylonychia lemnae]|uniref:Homeobox domain-containing protein n=1 Tax=Stylonychia lemnae TaxID=5949 RepID=A0A078ADV8_STYLE|nr:UNKNOWN [Stylonychia lemnae]|eukprot:CDW79722.1 UNKNOWN [Stylonychia lemnae]